ncbi:MAG: hypothetical protein IH840_08460 [Candidatus Heimdallarchaeota archaeon]|nr:hypothetical protein [Candidatus Heimdallarchaeota archaeon]
MNGGIEVPQIGVKDGDEFIFIHEENTHIDGDEHGTNVTLGFTKTVGNSTVEVVQGTEFTFKIVNATPVSQPLFFDEEAYVITTQFIYGNVPLPEEITYIGGVYVLSIDWDHYRSTADNRRAELEKRIEEQQLELSEDDVFEAEYTFRETELEFETIQSESFEFNRKRGEKVYTTRIIEMFIHLIWEKSTGVLLFWHGKYLNNEVTDFDGRIAEKRDEHITKVRRKGYGDQINPLNAPTSGLVVIVISILVVIRRVRKSVNGL